MAPETFERRFADLLAFGKEVAERFRPILGEPLVYGGLAYAAHTGDRELALGDIDFLAPEAALPRLPPLCGPDPSLHCEATTYHSVKVSRGGLKVSFDAIEAYLQDIAYEPVRFELAGFSFLAIDRAALTAAYARGAETIPVKQDAYRYKLDRLTRGG